MSETTKKVRWPDGKVYTVLPAAQPLTLGWKHEDGSRFLHRGDCHRGEQGGRTPVHEDLLDSLIDGERLRAFNGEPRKIRFCVQVMR